MRNHTQIFDAFSIRADVLWIVSDGPFIILSRKMSRRTGTGQRGKVSPQVRLRVSFAGEDPEVEVPAVNENTLPKSETACCKPQGSLSSKFSQRWGCGGSKPAAPMEVVGGEFAGLKVASIGIDELMSLAKATAATTSLTSIKPYPSFPVLLSGFAW